MIAKMTKILTDSTKRARELRKCKILGTPPEFPFDDITRLAAEICVAPIAYLNLLENEQLVAQSKIGLRASESPHDIAFCSHAMLERELFEVPDALEDERFSTNPLVVTGPKIRFYAGVPLLTDHGNVLGTLCVADRMPRQLTETQRRLLQVLSRQVVRELELRHNLQELSQAISDRESAERELATERNLLRTLLDHIPDVIYIKDTAGRYLYDNPAHKKFLGAEPEEQVVGQTVFDFLPSELAELYDTEDKRVIQLGEPLLNLGEEQVDHSGNYRYVLSNKIPLHDNDGKVFGLLCICRDISARRQAEEIQGQLAAIVDCSADAIISVDLAGVIQSWNPGAARMYGYSTEQMIGKDFAVLTRPGESAVTAETLQRIARGERLQHFEIVGVRKGGTLLDVSASISAVKNVAGEIVGASAIMRDITRQKRAERALSQSEEHFRLLVEGVQDYAILMLDEIGNIVSWNHGAERLYGYTAEEIIGQHCSIFYPQADNESGRPMEDLRRAVECRSYEFEAFRLRKNQSAFLACVNTTALYDADGKVRGFARVLRDVTVQRTAEAALAASNSRLQEALTQLRESQEQKVALERARALGCLATGVAHNLNNALSPILGFSELLLRSEKARADEEKLSHHLEMIHHSAKQAAEVVRNLYQIYCPHVDRKICQCTTKELSTHQPPSESASAGVTTS